MDNLKEIEFEIKKCCGNCRYSKFNNSIFGICEVYRFEPKIEGTEFEINQYSYCKKYGVNHSFVFRINDKNKDPQFCREFMKNKK